MDLLVTHRSADLLDRIESVLPRSEPRATARRVLEVMRCISRGTAATLYRERAGILRVIAGNRLPEAAVCAIRAALRAADRGVGLSSIWTSELGGPGWERSWVLWSGRPDAAERDVIYMQGPALRPAEECGKRLERLIALLGSLP